MHTPCVYYEEPLSLDITPNPNSISRLFLILLDPKSFQTTLDFYIHVTSRSHAYLLFLFLTLSSISVSNPNPRVSPIPYRTITAGLFISSIDHELFV